MTGQLGQLRYGVLSALEEDTAFTAYRGDEQFGIVQDGRKFGVFRLFSEVSKGYYRSLGFLSTTVQHPSGNATVYGVETKHVGAKGRLSRESQIIWSDIEGEPNGYGGFVDLHYAPVAGDTHRLSVEYLDRNLNLNDLGFIARNDQYGTSYRFERRRSNSMGFREVQHRVYAQGMWNESGERIRTRLGIRSEVTRQNQTSIRFGASWSPSEIEDRNSYGNGSFRTNAQSDLSLRYSSDSSKRFYYSLEAERETEDIAGLRYTAKSNVLYRPWDRLGMGLFVSYRTRDGWLLHRGGRNFVTYAADTISPSVNVQYFVNSKIHFSWIMQWTGIKADGRETYEIPQTGTALRRLQAERRDRSSPFLS